MLHYHNWIYVLLLPGKRGKNCHIVKALKRWIVTRSPGARHHARYFDWRDDFQVADRNKRCDLEVALPTYVRTLAQRSDLTDRVSNSEGVREQAAATTALA
jgi:hypothetical protein